HPCILPFLVQKRTHFFFQPDPDHPCILPFLVQTNAEKTKSPFLKQSFKDSSPIPAAQLRRLRPLALPIQTPYRTQSSPLGKGSDRGEQGSCKSFDPSQSPSNTLPIPDFPPETPRTALLASSFNKLLLTLLASYAIPLKIFVCRSWKYGQFVPIFAPLRKGGTAETAMTSGRKERDIHS